MLQCTDPYELVMASAVPFGPGYESAVEWRRGGLELLISNVPGRLSANVSGASSVAEERQRKCTLILRTK